MYFFMNTDIHTIFALFLDQRRLSCCSNLNSATETVSYQTQDTQAHFFVLCPM